jgi:hypothetical protein
LVVSTIAPNAASRSLTRLPTGSRSVNIDDDGEDGGGGCAMSLAAGT